MEAVKTNFARLFQKLGLRRDMATRRIFPVPKPGGIHHAERDMTSGYSSIRLIHGSIADCTTILPQVGSPYQYAIELVYPDTLKTTENPNLISQYMPSFDEFSSDLAGKSVFQAEIESRMKESGLI
jgi:hypothetical protein